MYKKLVIRDQFEAIRSHLNEDEVTVITGPRQVGKTTLVKQLMDDLQACSHVPLSQMHYVNFDVATDFRVFSDQTQVISFIKLRQTNTGVFYLFLDEIQRIDNPGVFIKGIYDLHMPVKLVVTGSSSLEIRSKINEPLTGRKRIFKMYPLSFKEYVSWFDERAYEYAVAGDKYARNQMEAFLDGFMRFGGYPKVALGKTSEEKILALEEIFTSYIDKDVVGLLNVRQADVFMNFVRILAEETGSLFNSRNTGSEIHLSYATICRYIQALIQTFIIGRVTPKFSSKRTEIRKMPKLYFIDTGIRNFAVAGKDMISVLSADRGDKGVLMENFVYQELIKAGFDDVHFWRTKDGSEVDFIVRTKGTDIPIEVKSGRLTKPSLSRSFQSYIKMYKPQKAILVSPDHFSSVKFSDTEVHFLLPYEIIKCITDM